MNRLREKNPFFDPASSGAVYVLNHMERAIHRFYARPMEERGAQDSLDF
jgi:hypothetical protein